MKRNATNLFANYNYSPVLDAPQGALFTVVAALLALAMPPLCLAGCGGARD